MFARTKTDLERINIVKQQIIEQRKFAGNGDEVLTTHLAIDIEKLIELAESTIKNKENQ